MTTSDTTTPTVVRYKIKRFYDGRWHPITAPSPDLRGILGAMLTWGRLHPDWTIRLVKLTTEEEPIRDWRLLATQYGVLDPIDAALKAADG